jgi:hypothetical protein
MTSRVRSARTPANRTIVRTEDVLVSRGGEDKRTVADTLNSSLRARTWSYEIPTSQLIHCMWLTQTLNGGIPMYPFKWLWNS